MKCNVIRAQRIDAMSSVDAAANTTVAAADQTLTIFLSLWLNSSSTAAAFLPLYPPFDADSELVVIDQLLHCLVW